MMERELIAQAKVSPHWLPGGNAFWYQHKLSQDRSEFVFVDAVGRTRRGGFDHLTLAEHIQEMTGQVIDPKSLLEEDTEAWDGPLNNINMKGKFLADEIPSPFAGRTAMIRFVNNVTSPLTIEWMDHVGDPVFRGAIDPGESKRLSTWAGHVWRLTDKETGTVRALYAAPNEDAEDVVVINESVVPQESGAGLQAENVFALKGQEGAADIPKVFVRELNVWLTDQHGDEQITQNATKGNFYDEDRIYMSPQKQHVVVWQYQPEQEHKVNLVESSPTDQLQPKLRTIQYLKPGDRVRVDRPRLFDVKEKREVSTDSALFDNPYDLTNIGWSADGSEYRFIFNERGHKHLRIIGINLHGHVRVLVEEISKTFIDYSNKLYHHVMLGTEELLWASERDGWNHLYLYNLKEGLLQNQVTKGQWLVRSVEKVDEEKRQIWFRGLGLVDGQDPYYAHLARINFDGSGLKILTEGDGMHTWNISPDAHYIVDSWSRVDYPPTTVLRDGETGEELLILVENKLSDLIASGWNAPERFAAPGRDGTTMIYGIIVRPSNLDPTKKYPVLEDIYAGPQGAWTPKPFTARTDFRQWADRGYVVVRLDGMGSNWRSKAFHDMCYKRLHDAGFPDRIAWIKAAAETRPWMDISRVGIKGVSAGGQNAGSALIFHNDFYKVAVADSGCHDNRMDKIWWNEQWMGWPVDKSYEDSSNVVNASKLQGNIMLIVGDMDDNVDPSTTFQFVNALNKAEKDYDFLFIPGGKHGCGESRYPRKRQSDFFARYLKS